ncbi:MAG: isoprenylcysteine carboxylmethyltransferase family protein [Candidatus Bathyarchaeota archaeon]|nr:isoprenylcysteine carboxylmethyltransferase family protein [Candidatus Bathyarchaeota archaeon]
MVKVSKDRTVLGAEHPYCDSLQLVMVTLFFVVWGLDSFVFYYSTFLAGLVPLALRLFLTVFSSGFGVYLSAISLKLVFGEEAEPKIIESGVYSWVRHPMYLGTMMFCLGFFLASLSLLSLGIWVVFFFFYDKMATYEEKDMIRILGEEYTAYQKRVPKWIPRLRRQS